ncbi:RNA polymerase sigma factor [Oscillatoria amoena NRMC-F 0135]|nr:RNA polymerase sigma factor [Oscillatoria amoena NRMC-F 0135]
MNSEPLNLHRELIDRCKQGDEQAYWNLYKLYSKAMFNTALRITGREDEAEDVLQEAFISAFRNLTDYRGDASFGSWLKRIVINKAINAVKKRRYELIPDDEEFDVAEEPEQQEMPGLTVDRVRAAMMTLPDGYRSVLSLYLLEGYDHQEIAGILQITESTSKSQLNRAKNKLRNLLIKEPDVYEK